MSYSTLYTSGYEGLDLEVFINQLKANNIQYLIDIREKPISRKKGFSKTKLEEMLFSKNIRYLHYRDLGSPSDLRKKVRNDGDLFYFFEQYSKHLSSQQHLLKKVFEITQSAICCLLCFEKDHEKCHRKIVAKEIELMSPNEMQLKHL